MIGGTLVRGRSPSNGSGDGQGMARARARGIFSAGRPILAAALS